MATSGQLNTNTTYDSYFWVKWEQNGDQDIANNRTSINWSCGVYCGHSFYSNAIKMSAVSINGTQVYGGGTYSNYSKGNHTIASGTMWISHDTDGTKTFSISSFTGWLYSGYDYSSAGGNYDLTTIPRYANFTQLEYSNLTETSIRIKWYANAHCDSVAYAVSGGEWVYTSGLTIDVTGLIPNTSYNIRLAIKRTDSQLWTYSEYHEFTTYDYPKPTTMNHFIIGEGAQITVYNPLSRNYTLDLVSKENNEVIGTYAGTYAGVVNAEFKTADAIAKQYASIPNKQWGGYYAKVTYGSAERILNLDATYTVQGNEVPTVNGVAYLDSDNDVVAITGNNQHIVQNQSNLQITYEPATPNYSAGSIAKYTFELNGVTRESTTAGGTVDFGKVDSANDLTLTLTVTDSRGLTAQKTLEIPMVAHSSPTATVTLERLNNYEDETYLTVDASISRVNGKNTMTVKYRYGLDADSYSPFVTIPNNEKQTLSLDKNSIFVFNVVVTDIFGTTFDREYILYKGVFPLFIDTEKNAVGINDFPAEGEALCVAEGVARFNDGIVLIGATKKFLLTVNDSGTLNIAEMKEGE